MKFKVGDLVTRNSYNNDVVFLITDISEKKYQLKGVNIRLYADAFEEDLKKCEELKEDTEEEEYLQRIKTTKLDDRDDYFYLPGKILHIDGDKDYLERCIEYYKVNKIWAIGVLIKEEQLINKIIDLLKKYNPAIIVITGHDAYYKTKDKEYYKNSDNFIKCVKEARKYEKNQEKLIIIAGACQSNFEQLIKAGANFASSPKRTNIHALDPAVIASRVSLSSVTKDIDLKSILEKTKYGTKGVGGIITRGTMYVGYPR